MNRVCVQVWIASEDHVIRVPRQVCVFKFDASATGKDRLGQHIVAHILVNRDVTVHHLESLLEHRFFARSGFQMVGHHLPQQASQGR